MPAREVPAEHLLGYLDAQLAFGPRPPGSAAHRATGRWLDSLLRVRADQVIGDEWTHVTSKGDTLALRNLLARFNPDANYRLLYVTHWDTRPRADGPHSASTAPVLGANDGASGVALLLGVADALRARPPSIGVDLLFVDGEDYGSFADTTETLIGSRRFARTLDSLRAPRFAIVWDLVADIVALVWRVARELGYDAQFVDEIGRPVIDDHLPLQRAGIKTIDVIDLEYGPDNAWHHSPEDTRDKISGESLARATHVATALIRTAPH